MWRECEVTGQWRHLWCDKSAVTITAIWQFSYQWYSCNSGDVSGDIVPLQFRFGSVCVLFMAVQRGQPSPECGPSLVEWDGWGGGTTDTDLHLLIELSLVSCHKPVTEHRLETTDPIIHHASSWHKATLAKRLRMMGGEVFLLWDKPVQFYRIWNVQVTYFSYTFMSLKRLGRCEQVTWNPSLAKAKSSPSSNTNLCLLSDF